MGWGEVYNSVTKLSSSDVAGLNLSVSSLFLEIHTIPLGDPVAVISTSCGEVRLGE